MRSYDYRSPVMTDIHRMLRYRHCEQLYITGPQGHCADGDCATATLRRLSKCKRTNGRTALLSRPSRRLRRAVLRRVRPAAKSEGNGGSHEGDDKG